MIIIRISSAVKYDYNAINDFKKNVSLILDASTILRFIQSHLDSSIDLNLKFDYVFGYDFDEYRFLDIILYLNESLFVVNVVTLEKFLIQHIHPTKVISKVI